MQRGVKVQPTRRAMLLMLIVSVLAALLSLVSALGTYAQPVEARTTEAWYSYQSSVGFDWAADVQKGKFYPDTTMRPDQLISVKGPVEPPLFHRVLISKFTDALEVRIPYSFKADRPAPMNVKWRVDGTLRLPGIWEQQYPLMSPKEYTVSGAEASGTETLKIPIADLLADIEQTRSLGILSEPMELQIKPVLEVTVDGLKQPVAVMNSPEFAVVVRASTTEVDDARQSKVDKNYAEVKVVPISMKLVGLDVAVATVRQVSVVALLICLLVAAGILWFGRKKPDERSIRQRLGANLIVARGMELPADAAVVDVRTPKELIQLQHQADRPVIRVGSSYYLQDGSVCYRLSMPGEEGDD
ncbi:MAG: hypothetical protein JWN15_320 [Firmicutes bacterium]|nr:hypothetical protein [Bacillota bacterium]